MGAQHINTKDIIDSSIVYYQIHARNGLEHLTSVENHSRQEILNIRGGGYFFIINLVNG